MPTRPPLTHAPAICLLALLLQACALPEAPPADNERDTLACPAPGTWAIAGRESPADTAEVLATVEDADVILLGEIHDREEDHRWQLHVLAGLHARQPRLALGLEMLPARYQDTLDAWVSGELDEEQLLTRVNWGETWGFPSELYLPALHFVRMHRVPAVALNADGETVRRISREGWEAVPAAEREYIGPPAEVPGAYRDRLARELENHPVPPGMERDDYLEMFIRGQTAWDRAMAERLAAASREQDAPVVGLVGRGHAEFGHGIPHQLHDLGIRDVAVLLAHRPGDACSENGMRVADALFGIQDGPLDTGRSAMRLGVTVNETGAGLEVAEIDAQGAAGQAGVRVGDVIAAAAGRGVDSRGDLLLVLDRQRPGSILELKVRREDTTHDIPVRFPGNE